MNPRPRAGSNKHDSSPSSTWSELIIFLWPFTEFSSLKMNGDFASVMGTVIPVTLLIGVVEVRALMNAIRKNHGEIASLVAAASRRVVQALKAGGTPSDWDLSIANRSRWPRRNHLIGVAVWNAWLVTALVNTLAEIDLIL